MHYIWSDITSYVDVSFSLCCLTNFKCWGESCLEYLFHAPGACFERFLQSNLVIIKGWRILRPANDFDFALVNITSNLVNVNKIASQITWLCRISISIIWLCVLLFRWGYWWWCVLLYMHLLLYNHCFLSIRQVFTLSMFCYHSAVHTQWCQFVRTRVFSWFFFYGMIYCVVDL